MTSGVSSGYGDLETAIAKAIIDSKSSNNKRFRTYDNELRSVVEKDAEHEFREYHKELHPYAYTGQNSWPASQVGSPTRANIDFQPAHINFGRLEFLLAHYNSKFRGKSSRDFIPALRRVCADLGMLSYSPEWGHDDSQTQLANIEESTDITVLMNKLVAEVSRGHAVNVFKDMTREKTYPAGIDKYFVLDLGCGAKGATIIPHLNMIHHLSKIGSVVPENYDELINVVLLDVNPQATNETAKLLKDPKESSGAFFKPLKNVVCLSMNFLSLDIDSTLRNYEGMFDTILAGASLCHANDLDSVFRRLGYLLSYRGAMTPWDWTAKTFAARYLRRPMDGRSGGDFFFYTKRSGKWKEVWQGNNLGDIPDRLYIELSKLNNKEWRSVYELKEEEVAPHHANIFAWLGYWDFHNPSGDFEEGSGVFDDYKEFFDQTIDTKEGFSPVYDFVMNFLTPMAKSRKGSVRYNFIESYGPDYAQKMYGAGLSSYGCSFDDAISIVRNSCYGANTSGIVDRLSPLQDIIKPAMRISVGCKSKDYFEEAFPGFNWLGNGR